MLRRKGDKHYLIEIYLGRDEKGKRAYYRETFHGIKSMAEHRERELKVALKKPRLINVTNATIGYCMDDWLAFQNTRCKNNEIEERTVETFSSHVKKLRPLIGNLKLYGLIALTVNKALEGKLSKLAPSTQSGIISTLRAVLRHAFAQGLVNVDISIGIKGVRKQKKNRTTLSFELTLKLIEAAKSFKHGLVIRMLSITGARLGEIAGLRWNDVDFRAGSITITVAADTRNRILKDKPKTEAAKRTIYMDDETMELLKAYRGRRSNDTLASFQNLVFMADDGRPLRHRAVQLTLRRTLKSAGLPMMRIHDLRHSAISMIVDKGVPLTEVMALAGHAGLDSTKPYIHNSRVGHNILDTMSSRRTQRRTKT